MDIRELQELQKFIETWEPTEEEVAHIKNMFSEIEEQFEQDAIDMHMTVEWLNKPFSTL